jgi:hypothetical protein
MGFSVNSDPLFINRESPALAGREKEWNGDKYVTVGSAI